MKLLMEGWRDYLGLDKKAEPEEEAPEPEEEEDEQSSMEANLAMLLMRGEEDQATMMFEMLAQIDEVDLDLLATEIDDRLRAEWEALPAPTKTDWSRAPTPEEVAQILKYSDAWQAWVPKLGAAVRFVTGGDKTQGFRPTASVYKLGSLKDTLAQHLRKTASAMKNPSADNSDEDLMENWRQYLKDKNLKELPLGADTGPIAEPGRETYKFKSREDMDDYTRWKNKGKLHKLNITYEDLLHALFSGRGRPLLDYEDESAEDWEARRAKEAEDEDLPVVMTPEKQQKEFDRLVDEEAAEPSDLKATGKYPDVDSLSSEVADRYFKRKFDWLEEPKIKK